MTSKFSFTLAEGFNQPTPPDTRAYPWFAIVAACAVWVAAFVIMMWGAV